VARDEGGAVARRHRESRLADKALTMADPLEVTDTVFVPAGALSMRAVRSSGPGGQHVNKVASRVELRVAVGAIAGLSEAARARLARLVARRLDAEGRWLVTSQRTRDQGRNLQDARDKVRETIAQALIEPRRRRATRPTAASKERRIGEKKRRAVIKSRRGGSIEE
jgi:ribosome-associated protein